VSTQLPPGLARNVAACLKWRGGEELMTHAREVHYLRVVVPRLWEAHETWHGSGGTAKAAAVALRCWRERDCTPMGPLNELAHTPMSETSKIRLHIHLRQCLTQPNIPWFQRERQHHLEPLMVITTRPTHHLAFLARLPPAGMLVPRDVRVRCVMLASCARLDLPVGDERRLWHPCALEGEVSWTLLDGICILAAWDASDVGEAARDVVRQIPFMCAGTSVEIDATLLQTVQ